MRISGIYKIQSRIKPERVYIGSSADIKIRFGSHKNRLIWGNHANRRLQNHVNKYGIDDLYFSLIVGCSEEILIAYEQFYIDALMPWFNISQNAGSTKGILHETRKGKSTWNKGKALSEEHKRNIGKSLSGENNPMYGKPSPIKGMKGKYPNKFNGVKGRYSEETLEKMRKSNKLAWEKRKEKEVNHAGN
jgi:group I intron endonuclease